MSILRDERLVALHDLVEACRASASHAALAAELLAGEEKGRAAQLQALADERSADADFFAERMIAEADIPGGPPEERSLLQTVLARARAAFADQGWEALVADCRIQEEAVCKSADAAPKAPLKDDEKIAAEALSERARQSLSKL